MPKTSKTSTARRGARKAAPAARPKPKTPKAPKTPTPAAVSAADWIIGSKPLWDQFQRIGGGLTPEMVSAIIRQADGGQPAMFVDLLNETRQKDGHIQGTLSTRETAPGLCDLDFISPDKPSRKERKALDVCKELYDDFKNWSLLIDHLNGGAVQVGHSTAQLLPWSMTRNGWLLPNECKPIHARDFIFTQDTGELRYALNQGDMVGVDLLAENPGRIVQIQRRIVGDVLAREGLGRILLWMGLLRNWDLRDWIAFGEIGWKPWRIVEYAKGTLDKDIARLMRAAERLGTRGVAAIQAGHKIDVRWPEGQSGSSGGTHRELYEALGREISKAVVGQTTSIESGPNGTRSDTAVRDRVRADIREGDCRAIAAALYQHLFMPAVAINVGSDVRCPVPWFQTEESQDIRSFADAVKKLRDAGLRIPAKWVRDEVGMPEPADDEELLEPPAAPEPDADEDEEPEGDGGGDGPTEDGTDAEPAKAA